MACRDRRELVPRHAVYGLTLASEFPFRWPLPPGRGPVDVRFTCQHHAPAHLDWEPSSPTHQVLPHDDADDPTITYHALETFDVVRIRGVADHYLLSDEIICHLHDPALDYLVEIQLLGLVLALWLERRGTPALHASAVVVEGGAVAFLGAKRSGKTSAATAMVAAGHPLLADDLLALVGSTAGIKAQPGYPMLRLWPDQAQHFLGELDALPLVHPAFDKRRVDVGARIGAFHPDPAPLRAIYLPTRVPDGEVTFEPLKASEAVIVLAATAFLRDAVHGLGLAAGRLAALAEVARQVPVRRVRYPSGLDRLGELVAAVESDLAAIAAAAAGRASHASGGASTPSVASGGSEGRQRH